MRAFEPTERFSSDGPALPQCPNERTLSQAVDTAESCQIQTHAPQQTTSLFNHLVSAGEQQWRYGKAKCTIIRVGHDGHG
jgi:hypothetical protein